MNRHRNAIVVLAVVSLMLSSAPPALAQTGSVDPEARAIAESVMDAMGGEEAWAATRYVSWNFFGGRQHTWDKWTGDLRIEVPEGEDQEGNRTPARLILMNIHTAEGRAWVDGDEVTGAELTDQMDAGWRMWVNDSYWAFMPWKLLDPGVNLGYVGEELMEDGREADVLEMTFEEVGVTPQNRYLVYVGKDSNLVEQWSYFPTRDAEEPRFTMPWTDWQWFGDIMICTDHGQGTDWNFRVHEELDRSVFTDPGSR